MDFSALLNYRESFADINFIPARLFWGISLTIWCGIVFLIAVLLAAKFVKLRNIFGKDYFLKIALIFWVPLLIFFYVGGLAANAKNLNFYSSAPAGLRSYLQIYDFSGQASTAKDLYVFLAQLKQLIPAGAAVHFFSEPASTTYLQYFLYPYFQPVAAARADYFIFYYYSPQADPADAPLAKKALGFPPVLVFNQACFAVKNNPLP
jgi:hypothetical protein